MLPCQYHHANGLAFTQRYESGLLPVRMQVASVWRCLQLPGSGPEAKAAADVIVSRGSQHARPAFRASAGGVFAHRPSCWWVCHVMQLSKLSTQRTLDRIFAQAFRFGNTQSNCLKAIDIAFELAPKASSAVYKSAMKTLAMVSCHVMQP